MGRELEITGDEKLAHDYADKLHQMDMLDGYSIHHRSEEVLQGPQVLPTRPGPAFTNSSAVDGECAYCWPK